MILVCIRMSKESSISGVFNEYFNKRKELEEYERSLRQREDKLAELELNVSRLDNEISEKTALFEKNQKTISKYVYDCSTVVRINVGGTTFYSTVETLKKSPYMESLFSGSVDHTKDGLFLDRDPKTFEKVLSFLRTDYIKLPLTRPLEIEFEYFELSVPRGGKKGNVSDSDSDSSDSEEESELLKKLNAKKKPIGKKK